MAGPTDTRAALMPQAYLNVDASSLGPALRQQPLVSAGIDAQGLDTLALDVQAAGAEQHIRSTHPSELELIVDAEPDRAHQAVVWHLGLAQSEPGSSPRLHDLQPLDITLDGALASDPVIHTWLGGVMQSCFPPDAATPSSRVLYPRTSAYYHGRMIPMPFFWLGALLVALTIL